ncbi:MAG: hypothetical protein JKY67_19350, partial [Pseudomonadales bacterium]|nr:hypothetical protein [Pseudomonadales bacterium]
MNTIEYKFKPHLIFSRYYASLLLCSWLICSCSMLNPTEEETQSAALKGNRPYTPTEILTISIDHKQLDLPVAAEDQKSLPPTDIWPRIRDGFQLPLSDD